MNQKVLLTRPSSDLFDQMKADILVKGQNKTGRIRGTGWKRIPSVSEYSIQNSEYNELLKEVGIKRKLPRRVTFKLNTNTNKCNIYMNFQIERLQKMIKQRKYADYWKAVEKLMEKSHAFRISAFNRVYPDWYRSMPIYTVKTLHKEVNRIIQTRDSKLKYHRVYIPKDGTDMYRPLGVPEEAWRVVMHMWGNFIEMAVSPELKKFNHGFMSGRGTNTAWSEVVTKVLDKKYIYEFDLKQFFPSVSHNLVEEALRSYEVPAHLISWFGNINRCTVSLPKEKKLDETVAEDKVSAHYQGLLELGPIAFELAQSEGYSDLWEYAKAQSKEMEEIAPDLQATAVGLPQGLNTSPILSILTLLDWHKLLRDRNIELTMYADDGLLFSDKEFEPYFPPLLTQNLDKSGWVKYNGTPIKDLKYLGHKYIWERDELEGSTKKGSTLKFEAKQKGIIPLLKELREVFYQRPGNWTKYLVESNIMGVIQSRLYCGSWAELSQMEGEWKIHPDSWWGLKSRTSMKCHPTLSSTAAQTHIGIVWGIMNRQKARYFKTLYRKLPNTL